MSVSDLNVRPTASKHGLRAVAGPVLVAVSLALLAGCAKRDHVIVGSVPDDYRTNHPIVIAEKDEVLDLPVAASERGLTKTQKVAVEGFLAGYDRSAAPVVNVILPVGAKNDVAASYLGQDLPAFMRKQGVPRGRIAVSSYDAGSAEVSAPVRITYSAMRAQAGKCGRWPEDILQSTENKHYANFGCAYQNNLAAQVANPSDLLGPRKQTEIDAARRGVAIDVYQNTVTEWEPEVEY
jgi:pilus assembly protein CpaD